MKSILYFGAVLMIGASIYGFTVYKKTIQQQAFKNMYLDEKNDVSDINEQSETAEKTADNITPKKEIKANYQKEFKLKSFSRAPLREEEIELKETEN